MTWLLFVSVFVGGGVGSLLRWGCGMAERSIRKHAERPADGWGTTLANTIASAVLGLTFGLAHGHTDGVWTAAIMTGLCGGLSTFSSFALELFTMIASKRWGRAAGHFLANATGGIVGFLLLFALGS